MRQAVHALTQTCQAAVPHWPRLQTSKKVPHLPQSAPSQRPEPAGRAGAAAPPLLPGPGWPRGSGPVQGWPAASGRKLPGRTPPSDSAGAPPLSAPRGPHGCACRPRLLRGVVPAAAAARIACTMQLMQGSAAGVPFFGHVLLQQLVVHCCSPRMWSNHMTWPELSHSCMHQQTLQSRLAHLTTSLRWAASGSSMRACACRISGCTSKARMLWSKDVSRLGPSPAPAMASIRPSPSSRRLRCRCRSASCAQQGLSCLSMLRARQPTR